MRARRARDLTGNVNGTRGFPAGRGLAQGCPRPLPMTEICAGLFKFFFFFFFFFF